MKNEADAQTMGLGKWAWVGNASAMLVIAVLFCIVTWSDRSQHAVMVQEGLRQAREDRALFRESVEKITTDNRAIWTEVKSLVSEVRRLTDRMGGPTKPE